MLPINITIFSNISPAFSCAAVRIAVGPPCTDLHKETGLDQETNGLWARLGKSSGGGGRVKLSNPRTGGGGGRL